MIHPICPGWSATPDPHAPPWDRPACYTAADCPHGTNVAHSINGAIACRLLQAVRRHRHHTILAACRIAGIKSGRRWSRLEQGRYTPTRPFAAAVERYVLRSIIAIDNEDPDLA